MVVAIKPSSAILTRRIAWILDAYSARPSLRYSDLVQLVRAEFQIGKSQAEVAIAAANRTLAEEPVDPLLRGRLVAILWETIEDARRRKEFRSVVRACEAIARITGCAAPSKIEHSGRVSLTPDEDYEDLTDEQLRLLATLDAKKPKPTEH